MRKTPPNADFWLTGIYAPHIYTPLHTNTHGNPAETERNSAYPLTVSEGLSLPHQCECVRKTCVIEDQKEVQTGARGRYYLPKSTPGNILHQPGPSS